MHRDTEVNHPLVILWLHYQIPTLETKDETLKKYHKAQSEQMSFPSCFDLWIFYALRPLLTWHLAIIFPKMINGRNLHYNSWRDPDRAAVAPRLSSISLLWQASFHRFFFLLSGKLTPRKTLSTSFLRKRTSYDVCICACQWPSADGRLSGSCSCETPQQIIFMLPFGEDYYVPKEAPPRGYEFSAGAQIHARKRWFLKIIWNQTSAWRNVRKSD